MFIGEIIYSSKTNHSYVIQQTFKSGGQAEIAYARCSDSEDTYFVKRLLGIKYSSKFGFKEKCELFEKEQEKKYDTINKYTIRGASCSYIVDFFREKTFYYVVTDCIVGTPLNTRDVFMALSLYDKLSLFKIMAYSLYPFEVGGIIHGDIKPENFLIKNIGNTIGSKLIDFESSFFVDSPPKKGTVVGTEPYYSPELSNYAIDGDNNEKASITTKSDIFSLGVIFFEIITGFYPNNGQKGKYCFEVVKKTKIELPAEFPNELRNLLSNMLSIDFNKRPDIMNILRIIDGIHDYPASTTKIVEPQLFFDRQSKELANVSIININPHSTIYYSLDHEAIKKYEHSFAIKDDDLHLKMIVHQEGATRKSVFERRISVSSESHGKVTKPTINISNNQVTISCDTPNARIYYTTDGTTPNKHAIKYEKAFMTADGVTIKSIAICIGMYPSEISSVNSSSKIKMH